MRPNFELSQEFSNGRATEPLIVPVRTLPAGAKLDRRVFFRAGITLSGVAALLASCDSPDQSHSTTAAHPATDSKLPDLPAATSEPAKFPDAIPPPVAKKSPRRRPRRHPAVSSDTSGSDGGVPTYRSVPSYRPYGGYSGGLGNTIERPCTPEPVPPGYICTCNCVAR